MKELGNDPTGKESIIIETDIIQANQAVPAADAIANLLVRDVLGNKLDSHSGSSIYAMLKLVNEHLHFSPMVYPLLANPVTLTKAAGAWAVLPTPTEIIPAGTITDDFDIHNLSVTSLSAAGSYIIAIYQGGAGVETLIGYKPVSRSAVNAQEGQIRFGSPLIAANTRISAAISSGNAATDQLGLKIEYHTY